MRVDGGRPEFCARRAASGVIRHADRRNHDGWPARDPCRAREDGRKRRGCGVVGSMQGPFFTKGAAQPYEVLRCETPPSGVSVRIERRCTRFNCGAVLFLQHTEKASLFECVSILVKGGWKETRCVQRPTSGHHPVSESRMASLNPFETKRKMAPSGTSSRVCNVQVAEWKGFEPSRRCRLHP